MQVLTYNIAGNRGRGRSAYLKQIAELIRKAAADVVGLQEVVHTRTDREPVEQVLARLTGMHATFLAAHQFKSHCLGNAVLCREPIEETLSHDLPHTWPERRILLEVQTTVRGMPVTVFCTHLVHMDRMAARLRLAQASTVAKRMSQCWRPHILVGDLNAGPLSRDLQPVRDLCGANDDLCDLRSWPARRPLILYDHIWPGPGWEIEKAEVLDLHVSDHRPLLATLAWRGAPRYNVAPEEAHQTATATP